MLLWKQELRIEKRFLKVSGKVVEQSLCMFLPVLNCCAGTGVGTRFYLPKVMILPGEYDRVQMPVKFKDNKLWSVMLSLRKLLIRKNKIIFT